MAENEGTVLSMLSKFLDHQAAQGMDSTSFICMLGLLNVLSIMNVLQRDGGLLKVAGVGEKKANDVQALVSTLSSMMAGQGGQKPNPAALLGLLNALAGQAKGEEKKPDEEAPAPARLEPRRVPETGGDFREGRRPGTER